MDKLEDMNKLEDSNSVDEEDLFEYANSHEYSEAIEYEDSQGSLDSMAGSDELNSENVLQNDSKAIIISWTEFPSILISIYLLTSISNILMTHTKTTELEFVNSVDMLVTVLIFSFYLALFLAARTFLLNSSLFTSHVLYLSSVTFGLILISNNPSNFYLTLGVVLIVGLITFAAYKDCDLALSSISLKPMHILILTTFLFLAMTGLLAAATIYRYRVFSASTFDFGVFTQMFEYLKTTGLPYTTVERDLLLSHFAIHFSPIYYLLLPGYYIFSSPEYLLVMQSIIICSGVFPILFLCRHFNLGGSLSLLIAIIYLTYPGIIAPAFFDFHENKFLTVLILWMIYFFEKKNYLPMYGFMVLTLLVKEDAALYIIFIGLFYAYARQRSKHGIIMTLVGIGYFMVIVVLMSKFGYGIMDYRFSIYRLPDETGLVSVAMNILENPAFFIKNLFSEKKLIFIIYILGPLLFVPLMSRNMRNLILFIPMIVINLMTAYPYQYDIGFQYAYGVSAIMLYLFILNIKEFQPHWRRIICLIAVVSSISFMYTATNNQFTMYFDAYKNNQTDIALSEAILAKIPRDATVASETFFIPHISDIDHLYFFPSKNDTDYLVLDKRLCGELVEEKANLITEKGYRLVKAGGYVLLYKK